MSDTIEVKKAPAQPLPATTGSGQSARTSGEKGFLIYLAVPFAAAVALVVHRLVSGSELTNDSQTYTPFLSGLLGLPVDQAL